MTHDEILQELTKLRYHVDIIGRTIDSDNYPVESLVLSMGWSADELNKAHDIFEKWDKRLEGGGNLDRYEFEQDFADELEVSYQGLKSIILAFYRNHQWTNVCEAYVDSFGPSPAIEYHSIMNRER
jgi:hypothetical protein